MKTLKMLILGVLLTIGQWVNAEVLQHKFLNNITVKENYVLVDEAGLTKIVVPFHYCKTTTDFIPKRLLRINRKRIRKVEYVRYENRNKKYQEQLDVARIDTLNNMLRNRLKLGMHIAYSTIILSNDHIDRTQFTGFVITIERTARENVNFLRRMLNADGGTTNETLFTLDTLKEYGYVLPHFNEDAGLKEYAVINGVMIRHKDWRDKLIVVDVTGSMTPYIVQYLIWLRLNYDENEKQNFVFFNDGDDARKRKRKLVGETGGIYFAENNDGFDLILRTVELAMINGSGGDCPENNVEALIKGNRRYGDAKEVIMVADNFATPRDLELMSKLDKPVRIILCGVRKGELNEHYLNLAYVTKGSVHTMEDDLEDLFKRKEGEKFKFAGKWYWIKGGKIEVCKAS
jgi:hypothetical protein